ncbi:MAG: tetratricopeptide repeat protein [Verrucomicrobiota bacterium]
MIARFVIPLLLLGAHVAFAQDAQDAPKHEAMEKAFGFIVDEEGEIADDAPPVVKLTREVKKSLVSVSHFGRDGAVTGTGSGFVISEDGLIATCLHVVGEARRISVEDAAGQFHEVKAIHAWNKALDLAVLRVDAKGLTPLDLGDSDTLEQGQEVFAFGNPLGFQFSVVPGLVSAVRKVEPYDVEMVQLAMPIEPGNSGGPLIDAQGTVHGLVNMKSSVTDNLGFAMPVNALKSILEKPNTIPIEGWVTIGAIDNREWTTLFGGEWRQRAGRIIVDSAAGNGFGGRALCLSQTEPPEEPYEVAVSVKLDDESGAAGLAFASDGNTHHYGFYPSGGRIRLSRFEGASVFQWKVLEELDVPGYRRGGWNTLRVRVEEKKIIGFVNEQKVVEIEDDVLRGGKVGLAKFRDTAAEFRRFDVGPDLALRTLSRKESLALDVALDRAITGNDNRPISPTLTRDPDAVSRRLTEKITELENQLAGAQKLEDRIHREAVKARFQEEIEKEDAEVDLAKVALLIARYDNAEVEIESYLGEIDRLAARASEWIEKKLKGAKKKGKGDLAKLELLGDWIFERSGFHGSTMEYSNRSNSYLNEVIDDREGIPITLSILYMELARKMGIDGLAGYGLPGHFVVRLENGEGKNRVSQFVDVYEGGKFISEDEADEIVATFGDPRTAAKDYGPTKKREITLRLLRNLKIWAIDDERYEASVGYADLTLLLNPDDAQERLSRALLYIQMGEAEKAKSDLEWLFHEEPVGINLTRLRELYDRIDQE